MQKENATILLGDCLEVLKTLPDNSVDAIVTDPHKIKNCQLKENLWKTENGAYYRWGRIFAAVGNSLVYIGDYHSCVRGFSCRYQNPQDINHLFIVRNKNGSVKKFKYAFECADYVLDLAKTRGFFCYKKHNRYMRQTAHRLQFPKEPKVSKYQ